MVWSHESLLLPELTIGKSVGTAAEFMIAMAVSSLEDGILQTFSHLLALTVFLPPLPRCSLSIKDVNALFGAEPSESCAAMALCVHFHSVQREASLFKSERRLYLWAYI